MNIYNKTSVINYPCESPDEGKWGQINNPVLHSVSINMRTRKKWVSVWCTQEHNSKIATGTEGTGEMERVRDTRKDWEGWGSLAPMNSWNSCPRASLQNRTPSWRENSRSRIKIEQGRERERQGPDQSPGEQILQISESRLHILILYQNTEEALWSYKSVPALL